MYLKISFLVTLACLVAFIMYLRQPTYKVYELDSGIFDVGVKVILTTDTAVARQYVMANLDSSVTSEDFNSRATTFGTVDGKPVIIWLSTTEDVSVVHHELLHASINILDWAGIKLSADTEEVYAYQLQYLTKQFYARRSN